VGQLVAAHGEPQRVAEEFEMAGVRYRHAGEGQTDEVLAILNEAAVWLRSRGIEQWPESFGAAQVAAAIRDGHTWLVDVDGVTGATVTLDWCDPLWSAGQGDAGYLHRLAVRRSLSGLGDEVLTWAADQVKGRGRRFLRLDCVATNIDLRGYYERRGFRHRGDVDTVHLSGQRPTARSQSVHSLYEAQLDPELDAAVE
jgi:hypothetical protein